MFDRLFESLNPNNEKNYLDNSIERTPDKTQAAMYEATCDKYEQVTAYHESGQLMKDFRRIYRINLKNK